MHVVATAGHVDHGKSTLVHALTGIDPDRFAEEKRRGLTIDLGFAWTTLPSGAGVAFVDVPGHVRFLKNMLAGVGAVDACVFVVAATEGWKPQSEEHLRILELLGIRHGLVALTKVGLVDDDDRELAILDLGDHVSGTFLETAEVVAVDPPTGVGVANLRLALDRLLAHTPIAVDHGRPRLWVDRSFVAAGSGTIVTGTLTGGSLQVDDRLAVGNREVRLRAIQSQGEPHDTLPPGRRAALNLAGIHHDDIVRGDAVVRPGQWHATRVVDASLAVLTGLGHDVTRRGAYVAYVGSGEYPVKVRVLNGSTIRPGHTGFVRLHLPVPLPLLPGDRYVLRESGRKETEGGGEILDVAPVLPASKARPDRDEGRVIAERGWVDVDELERLTGIRRQPDVGQWVVHPARLQAQVEALQAKLDAGLDLATLDERERALLDRCELPATTSLATHPYLAELEAHPFDPPLPADVDRSDLRELIRQALVVEQDGLYFAAAAIKQASLAVAELLAAKPDGVTVGDVREVLHTSRKWAVPLLTHLDATGVTRRRGDVRIAGPLLPDL